MTNKTETKLRQLMGLVGDVNALALELCTDVGLADDSTEFSQWPEIVVIQAMVADHYKLHRSAMTEHTRSQEKSFPRQVAMALSRDLTTYAITRISKCFDRDHGTIIHAIRAISNRRDTQPTFALEYRRLSDAIAPKIQGLRAGFAA